jgi:hypothetical protein
LNFSNQYGGNAIVQSLRFHWADLPCTGVCVSKNARAMGIG